MTAVQAGDANYLAAASVARTFQVRAPAAPPPPPPPAATPGYALALSATGGAGGAGGAAGARTWKVRATGGAAR